VGASERDERILAANRELYWANDHLEPLSPAMRRGVLALVILLHVGVAAEAPPEPQINIPVPEDTPPPAPELESMIQPPPPDLPPPAFPVQAPPPPPPKPKPQAAKPPPPKPHPALPAPSRSQAAAAQPQPPAAPKTVGASQVSFLVRPNPVYPSRSRRNNEQGVAMVRVLIDIGGRPSQVSLQTSSGYAALDESALSAVRAAQFRPYSEGGAPQPVWVLVPIKFVLQ
jgi:protein TonB